MEESTGLPYRFVMPGPAVSPGEADAMLKRLRRHIDRCPGYVVASGSLPVGVPDDFYARLATEARALGAKCIVDTHGDEAATSVETEAKAEATTPDAPKAEAPAILPGKLILMSAGDDKPGSGPKPESEAKQARSGMRRVSAVAAVAVLAAVTGALGGALATGGLSRLLANDSDHNDKRALEASVARIEADMVALKAWAQAEGISGADDELLCDARTRALFEREIKTFGHEFKGYESIRDFVLSAEELSTANDMMTPTLKLKRRNVMAAYEPQLKALYRGAAA
jgi:hypothetical protein